MRILIAVCLLLCSCSSKKEVEAELNYDPDSYQVAFLIMDGVYNTELTAPFDVFQHTTFREGIKKMNVFTIAERRQNVRTFEGLNIRADYGFNDDYPPIDVLVIPSAESHLGSALQNQVLLDFVRKTDSTASWMTSHCDGSFVLGAAGLLNGKWATTFPSDLKAFEEKFPEIKVVHNKIVVHDGKYITSAGGAKSFEAALYLSSHLYGERIANELAGGLVLEWKDEMIDSLVYRVP